MSTRAHIIVTDGKEKHYVYHHCDGYPEGVGAELRKYLFNKGDHLETESGIFCENLSNWDSQYEYEDYGLHGDEEYVYLIDLNNKLFICYDVPWDVNELELDKYKIEFHESISFNSQNNQNNDIKQITDRLEKIQNELNELINLVKNLK